MSALRIFIAAVMACFSLAASAEVVMVPMRDGVKLATEFVFPKDGEGPFPVVLARSFYGRSMDYGKSFVDNGMAFVIQDTRGRGESEGVDGVFATDGWGDLQDGADTVQWLLKQPWCDGKIGTYGASALGLTQMLLSPVCPEIKCQVIQVADNKFYGHFTYYGGVWVKSLLEVWLTQILRPQQIDVFKAHPTEDAFWANYNIEPMVGKVNTPALHIGGWWDIFGQGTLDHFNLRQLKGGEGARGKQQLIMGPWLHGPVPNPGDLKLPDNFDDQDFNAYGVAFMAHYLKGADNGVDKEPAVKYYTIGDVEDPTAPGNEWRTADAWPPFPTIPTAFYPDADGGMTKEPPAAASKTYAYDPNNPVPSKGGANLTIEAGPYDQRAIGDRADVLKFVTPVLDTPVEITGQVLVKLFVKTDAPDTDFTAKLVDIYPDGREILMLDGIQRLKFRNGFTKADPLPAGEIGEVTIDLWSISLIFNKGHRIGLQLSSSNYQRFEINPNNGDDFPTDTNKRIANNTILLGGEQASAIILPVRPATQEAVK